jgi:hypothetical protein
VFYIFKRSLIAFVFLLTITSSILPTISEAANEFTADEIYDPFNLITTPLHYVAADNSIELSISGTEAVKVYYASMDATYTTATTDKEEYPSDYGWNYFNGMGFNCNTNYKGVLYNASGDVLVRVKINITGLVNPVCDATQGGVGDDGKGMGGNTPCDSCAVFDCPGWSQYMSKLDEIKSSIPPAPNWGNVADTFRDSIAPQIKSDLNDLLGRAPDLPQDPSQPQGPDLPQAPDQPSGLDDRGITQPTGNEDAGLGGAGFDQNDIKNGAPTIPERADPTGGFKIDNPVDGLPSQDEFIKNAPIEGEVPLPSDPKDPENLSPSPNEGDNITPGDPTEIPNHSPSDPTEQDNPFPSPGDDNNTAPIPGGDNSTAPLPGNDGSTAPIPGDDNSTAPIPGN